MKRNLHLGSFVIYQIIDHFTDRLLEQHSRGAFLGRWILEKVSLGSCWQLLAAAGIYWHLLAFAGSDNCTVLTGGGTNCAM